MPDHVTRTKVLIVDDNAVTVALLKGLLHKDYDVDTAMTSQECLTKVPVFLPDIVLLDILITELNGYEICQWIRQTMTNAQPIIMAISSQSTVQDKMMAYQAGMDDYIVKPFSDDEVTAKIRVYARLKAIDKQWKAARELLSDILSGARDCVRSIEQLGSVVLSNPALSPQARSSLEALKKSGEEIQEVIKSDIYEKTHSDC